MQEESGILSLLRHFFHSFYRVWLIHICLFRHCLTMVMHFVRSDTVQPWKEEKGALWGFIAAICPLISPLPLSSACVDTLCLVGCVCVHDQAVYTTIKPETWLPVSGTRPRFLEIIFIPHNGFKVCGAQTLVIAATSWAMLFEEIIMDSW